MFWSHLSDIIGRKPIIALGVVAISVSILRLGVSTTFLAVVVSRCFFNGFNNNEAIIRCAVGEMTDESNSPAAFALLQFSWTLGQSLGPLIGGYLSHPGSWFPELFSGNIWLEYPYLLPCVVVAVINTVGLWVLWLRFNEVSLISSTSNSRKDNSCQTQTLLRDESNSPAAFALLQFSWTLGQSLGQLVKIRSLLTPRVVLAIANFVAFSLLHAAVAAVQPLFLAMPVSVGGFGLQPAQVGLILSTRSIIGSLTQLLLLGFFLRKFGLRRVFTVATASFIPAFLLFPILNISQDPPPVNRDTPLIIPWLLLLLQCLLLSIAECGYACACIYITGSARDKQNLGTINGLTQIPMSLSRLAGEASVTFMLGLSIEKRLLGGYAVYVFMSFVVYLCVLLVRRLPRDGC
ncbi:hypothetical protein AN958_11017 [Leucoagaricus sp. SymC.cos]|nr:hypothetical protein AN958_11017 [Leucoagaricus sp. SymC.cos]